MPLTADQKLQLIKNEGLDPTKFYVNDEETAILPLESQVPAEVDINNRNNAANAVLQKNPQAQTNTGQLSNVLSKPESAPESSMPGAAFRGARRSAIPTIAGLAGAGLAAAPFTGGGSLAVPLIAALAGGVLGGVAGEKGQEYAKKKIYSPEELSADVAQEQADLAQHPVATRVGSLLPQAAFFKPSPSNVKSAAKLVFGGSKALSKATPVEMGNLVNVGVGGVLGGVTSGVLPAMGGQPVNPTDVALSMLTGSVLNKPTAVGKLFFHEPKVQPTTTPTAHTTPEGQVPVGVALSKQGIQEPFSLLSQKPSPRPGITTVPEPPADVPIPMSPEVRSKLMADLALDLDKMQAKMPTKTPAGEIINPLTPGEARDAAVIELMAPEKWQERNKNNQGLSIPQQQIPGKVANIPPPKLVPNEIVNELSPEARMRAGGSEPAPISGQPAGSIVGEQTGARTSRELSAMADADAEALASAAEFKRLAEEARVRQLRENQEKLQMAAEREAEARVVEAEAKAQLAQQRLINEKVLQRTIEPEKRPSQEAPVILSKPAEATPAAGEILSRERGSVIEPAFSTKSTPETEILTKTGTLSKAGEQEITGRTRQLSKGATRPLEVQREAPQRENLFSSPEETLPIEKPSPLQAQLDRITKPDLVWEPKPYTPPKGGRSPYSESPYSKEEVEPLPATKPAPVKPAEAPAAKAPEAKPQPSAVDPAISNLKDKAAAALSYWQGKIGKYRSTNLGLEAGGASGKALGGTFKEINERRAATNAAKLEALLKKEKLTPGDIKDIERFHTNLPKGNKVSRAAVPVEESPVQPKKGITIKTASKEKGMADLGVADDALEGQAGKLVAAGARAASQEKAASAPTIGSGIKTALEKNTGKTEEGGALNLGLTKTAPDRYNSLDVIGPEVDEAAKHGPSGVYFADKWSAFLLEQRKNLGKILNSYGSIIRKPEFLKQRINLPEFVNKRLGRTNPGERIIRYRWEEFNEEPHTVTLTPAEAKLNAETKANDVRVHDIQRSLGITVNRGERLPMDNPRWLPPVKDPRVQDIILNKPNSPEANKLRDIWIDFHKRKEGLSTPEAEKAYSDYVEALSSPRQSSAQAATVRRSEGLGLPWEWQEKNLGRMYFSYATRVGRDFAYNQTIERDPVARTLFDVPDEFGSRDSNATTLPDGTPITPLPPHLRESAHSWIANDFSRNDVNWNAFSSLVNSGVIGLETVGRNLVASPARRFFYLGPKDAKLMLVSPRQVLKGYQAGMRTGVIRSDITDILNPVRGHSKAATAMNWLTSYLYKAQGVSLGEKLDRSVDMGTFMLKASKDFEDAASTGKATDFMKQFGERTDYEKYVGKPLKDVPDEVIEQMAANATEWSQGSYDPRSLPGWASKGSFMSPFFRLSRWSIGNFNNQFTKDILQPIIKRNDYGPLIKAVIGSTVVGTAGVYLNEIMKNKKTQFANVGEAIKDHKAITSAVMGILKLSGFGGILGDMVSSAYQVSKGKAKTELTLPAITAITRMGDATTDMMGAVKEASSSGEALEIIAKWAAQLGRDNIQTIRMVMDQLDKDKSQLASDRRDFQMWKDLYGIDSSGTMVDSTAGNPFDNPPLRKWRDAKTKEEIQEAKPGLRKWMLDKRREQPHNTRSILSKATYAPQLNIMPNPKEDPALARDYLDWRKTMYGKEESDRVLSKDQKQKALNAAKNSMITGRPVKAGK